MPAEDILAANRKIALLSLSDELTGLLNLRAFHRCWTRDRRDRHLTEGVSRAAEVLDKADLALYNSKHGGLGAVAARA